MRDLKITTLGPGDIKPQEPPSYWEDEVEETKEHLCEDCDVPMVLEDRIIKPKITKWVPNVWELWVCPKCGVEESFCTSQ